MKGWETWFCWIAIVILGIYFFNKYIGIKNTYEFLSDGNSKLLCVPNPEKRDYNLKYNKYEKKYFQPAEADLIISVEKNKLIIHFDNGKQEFPRVKINADAYKNTFVMRFNKKQYDLNFGFILQRKSGRLTGYKQGGQYGIDKNIQIETYYNCSKFTKAKF